MSGSESKQASVRRYKAFIDPLGITMLHKKNPFVVAWWSAAFPGFGHMLLSKFLCGYILFLWEVAINTQAQINLAILYSFTGRFYMAKEVLNTRWVLLYIPVYFFTIWDSYRSAVDLNQNYLLAAREDAEVRPFKISEIGINYLDKRSPWAAFIWSALSPGTGQFYVRQMILSSFIIIWWILVVYFSNLLPAILYTLLGEFQQASSILRPHWFLNIPSTYFFAMYDAHVRCTESNKLFDWEQAKFLNKNYQDKCYHMPSNRRSNRGEGMYIISTFEHSLCLESAITAIQMKGIAKEDILAVPMDKRGENGQLFDTLHSSDGKSLLDLPMVLAALFTLFGGIYGFVLKWGPIIWGLIGTVLGLSIGIIVKLFTIKKFSNRQKNKTSPGVVLIIECSESQVEMVKDTLWSNHALGVQKLILGSDQQ